ncbi:MAG TPA: metallophosphoesterase family protein [Candidatus Dormibacteraeota bacterium]|nr:metallophosphoesterase family protein [Candidatus Dormibacteraeota bacterium]
MYDVHGNLPALTAVLSDVDALGVDTIVVGGDVAWGPMPADCLDLLRERGARFIRGNADRVLDIGGDDESDVRVPARRWVATRLDAERLDFLASLPLDLTLDVNGLGPVRFCHGAPHSDELAITRLTTAARLADLLTGIDERVVICGHTHVQFDRTAAGIRVVNAGSVGRPCEAEPAAYWALLDGDVKLRRTSYDIASGVQAMLATGFPLAADAVSSLSPDPDRPARVSRVIEEAAEAAWRRGRPA